MPQAAIAAMSGILGYGLSGAVAAGTVSAMTAAFITAGTGIVFGELTNAFADQDVPDNTPPNSQLPFTAPDAPRDVVYGRTRKSGPIIFRATSGDDKEYLHLLIALASHEVEEIGTGYFDGKAEGELLHTHQPQRADIFWRAYPGGKRDPAMPDEWRVIIDDVLYEGTSVDDLADIVNAAALGISAAAQTKNNEAWPNYPTRILKLEAEEAGRQAFRVRPRSGDSSVGYQTFIGDHTDAGVEAFKIWRHNGAANQAADQALIDTFGAGRRARVALKWDQDRAGISLQIGGQTMVGKVDDIKRYIDSSAVSADIEVRRTSEEAELILHHRQVGENIEFSSSNSDFSYEWLDSPAPAWTEDHKLSGIAYVHIRLARRTAVWGGRVPNVAFDLKGAKLLDVRTGETAWSDNWALAVRDYLVRVLQVPDELIDDAEVARAATICDERVSLNIDGDTQARYTVNGVFTEAEKPGDVLGSLSQHGGWIIRRAGIWSPQPFARQEPISPVVDGVDLLGFPDVELGHDGTALYNAVQGTWSGDDSDWYETPAPLVTSPFYKEQDNDRELITQVRYRFTDDAYRAQRLAKIALERHRQQITVRAVIVPHRLDVEVGAIVPLTIAELGWVQKLFFVASCDHMTPQPSDLDNTPGTAGGRAVVLREYADAMFDWNYGEATLVDLADNTRLRTSRYIEAPRELRVFTSPSWHLPHSNGVELASLFADWQPPVGGNVDHYQMQWRSEDAPTWRDIPTTRATQLVHSPIPDTSAIDVRIQAVGPVGRTSRWLLAEGVPVFSVASITGGDGVGEVTKSSSEPTEPDVNDIWIQTDASGATVARYYWAGTEWVDIAGSAILTAVADSFEAKALADGSARFFAAPSSDPPDASGTGDLWLQTDTQRVMHWTGTAWEVASSRRWEDIFGVTKPDNLANSDGGKLIDGTLERLANGDPTWTLRYGAQVVDEGLDGAAVRLHASSDHPAFPQGDAILSTSAMTHLADTALMVTMRAKPEIVADSPVPFAALIGEDGGPIEHDAGEVSPLSSYQNIEVDRWDVRKMLYWPQLGDRQKMYFGVRLLSGFQAFSSLIDGVEVYQPETYPMAVTLLSNAPVTALPATAGGTMMLVYGHSVDMIRRFGPVRWRAEIDLVCSAGSATTAEVGVSLDTTLAWASRTSPTVYEVINIPAGDSSLDVTIESVSTWGGVATPFGGITVRSTGAGFTVQQARVRYTLLNY